MKEIKALLLQVFLLVRAAKVLQLHKAVFDGTKVYADFARQCALPYEYSLKLKVQLSGGLQR